eukprot:6208503-Pleurochrysis_carterae.AAC.1
MNAAAMDTAAFRTSQHFLFTRTVTEPATVAFDAVVLQQGFMASAAAPTRRLAGGSTSAPNSSRCVKVFPKFSLVNSNIPVVWIQPRPYAADISRSKRTTLKSAFRSMQRWRVIPRDGDSGNPNETATRSSSTAQWQQ